MKFFLDTANIDEIRDAAEYGLIDGVTTNPSLAKALGFSGRTISQGQYWEHWNLSGGRLKALTI